jgi:hypothetical protein
MNMLGTFRGIPASCGNDARCTLTWAYVWQISEFNSALVELWRMGVLLMVTSRRAVNARLQGHLKLELRSLEEQDAMQLLRSYATVAITEEQAQELAAICGGNPLAITIIAAFLSDGVVTPEVRSTVISADHAPCVTSMHASTMLVSTAEVVQPVLETHSD